MKFRELWSEDTQQFHFYWSQGDEQMSPTFTDKETACYWLWFWESMNHQNLARSSSKFVITTLV